MSPYTTYFYTGSIHVQYVALQEYLSHPRLVIYFFPNLTHQNETWRLQKAKDRIVLATHVEQSKYLANQQQVLGVFLPFASLFILCKMFGGNHFAEPNRDRTAPLRERSEGARDCVFCELACVRETKGEAAAFVAEEEEQQELEE